MTDSLAENILVIKLGALGDFVQALGAMAAIRRHHPAAHVALLTSAPFAGLGKACGAFDEVVIDARPRWSDPRGWLALRKKLKSGNYARVYDLQNSDRTALYLRLLAPRPPEWVGAARGASHRNADPARIAGHALDGHAMTLALVGIKDVRVDDLSWMKSEVARFGLPAPYALLVPGCSPAHPEKRWPPAFFAALAKALKEDRGVTPVLIGTADDSGAVADILKAAPFCIDLCGKTALFDLAGLARGAALAVGNDTGPMHLIAATGCPALALFSGRSDPVRHAPKGAAAMVLREENLADLSPEKVTQAALALSHKKGNTGRAAS